MVSKTVRRPHSVCEESVKLMRFLGNVTIVTREAIMAVTETELVDRLSARNCVGRL